MALSSSVGRKSDMPAASRVRERMRNSKDRRSVRNRLRCPVEAEVVVSVVVVSVAVVSVVVVSVVVGSVKDIRAIENHLRNAANAGCCTPLMVAPPVELACTKNF